jgi:uncharacterized phage-associated protein
MSVFIDSSPATALTASRKGHVAIAADDLFDSQLGTDTTNGRRAAAKPHSPAALQFCQRVYCAQFQNGYNRYLLEATMPYTPEAIANYFITHRKQWEDLTPMKLQKLVYFAHGWHLALKDQPPIDEEIQAWEYGPVIERLYKSLRHYGNTQITEPIRRLKAKPGLVNLDAIDENQPSLDDQPEAKEFTTALLNRMWDMYGGFQTDGVGLLPFDRLQQSQAGDEFGARLGTGMPVFGGIIS